MGMREKIKRGEMTPKQALEFIYSSAAPSYFGTHSQSFIRWCERRIRKTRKKK